MTFVPTDEWIADWLRQMRPTWTDAEPTPTDPVATKVTASIDMHCYDCDNTLGNATPGDALHWLSQHVHDDASIGWRTVADWVKLLCGDRA